MFHVIRLDDNFTHFLKTLLNDLLINNTNLPDMKWNGPMNEDRHVSCYKLVYYYSADLEAHYSELQIYKS